MELAHMHKGEVFGVEKEFEMTRLWVRRNKTLRVRVRYLTLEWRSSGELTGLCAEALPVISWRVQSWHIEKALLGDLDWTLVKEKDRTQR